MLRALTVSSSAIFDLILVVSPASVRTRSASFAPAATFSPMAAPASRARSVSTFGRVPEVPTGRSAGRTTRVPFSRYPRKNAPTATRTTTISTIRSRARIMGFPPGGRKASAVPEEKGKREKGKGKRCPVSVQFPDQVFPSPYSLFPSLALEGPSHGSELRALGPVDRRVLQVEARHGVDDRRCHHHASEPFVIGRHDIPGRGVGGRRANGVLIGSHVLVPVLTLLDVARRELPLLLGVVDARKKALLLFLLRHVEEQLANRDAVLRQIVLEVPDVSMPVPEDPAADQGRRQLLPEQDLLVHTYDQNFFVVRAVEDPDAAPLRQAPDTPPEIVVIELFAARR